MKRAKFVKQHDSMQCGAACLSMICGMHGATYPLDMISRMMSVSNTGVSMYAISETAKTLGFQTSGQLIGIEQLASIDMPCIIHWNQNHFVVLQRITHKGDKFHIIDPSKGFITYSREDFSNCWISTFSNGYKRGSVLTLTPTSNFGKVYECLDGEKRTFRFLLGYINQYRKYFALIVAGLFLGCILQLILPFLTQSIVDVGINKKDIQFIWLILLGELMIITGRTAMDFIRRWLLLHISMRINISRL